MILHIENKLFFSFKKYQILNFEIFETSQNFMNFIKIIFRFIFNLDYCIRNQKWSCYLRFIHYYLYN